MGQNSKIEWTHHTFNPWRGCTKVSPGCTNCYAEKLSMRNPKTLGVWGDNGTRVVAVESYWRQPVKWNREAKEAGERRRVFCASLADVFEDRPELVEPRYRLFDLINNTPDLDWLLLTKRPENVNRIYDDIGNHFGWDENMSVMNIWLGTTVENQEYANQRIPELLNVPAVVRFLSCEPLLGPVSLEHVNFGNEIAVDVHDVLFPQWGPRYPGNGNPFPQLPGNSIDWVICGGESGPHARPMHPLWALSLRDQCKRAGVPFFFKQNGRYAHQWGCDDPCGQCVMALADGTITGTNWEAGPAMKGSYQLHPMSKEKAGRLLDGAEHNGFPQLTQEAKCHNSK